MSAKRKPDTDRWGKAANLETSDARRAKVNADWLADHPGKTIQDADFAASCGDTPRGHKRFWKWYEHRYGDRDPLDC